MQIKENPTIGFIGTGVMGKSMAGHLMDAGYKVLVYNRTKSRAEDLLEKGAMWKETPKELAAACDVVITMIGYPHDVEEVYLGKEGLVNNARPGTVLIDMTTSTPSLARRIAEEGEKKGIFVVDAPVSGGDIGAQNATLAIMVGGKEEVFEAVRPIFELMGKNIIRQGDAGAGQHTKMCNQIVIASTMMGVCEAVVYAEKAGLDPELVLQSISTGAAGSWSLSNLAPRMINGDFNPGFYIKHFVKDMGIALAEAEAMGFHAPGLELAKSLYDQMVQMGEGELGTQALYKLIREN
ncbi:MAG TPA: oxidoreductase [Paenibacillaceae bacterium]|nr:oxidoreductase [Paenibacillaceae bacterium]